MFNPFHLQVTELLVWGIVIHLICDWLLQNEWMALNKMKRMQRHRRDKSTGQKETFTRWWDRHPAAYVHSGIHLLGFLPLLGLGAVFVAATHLIIDCRWVVAKWSSLIGQTQPKEGFDIGADVRIWNDQVWHIFVVAVAALIFA